MEKESTIMFTDMVGYSRLVNIDESKALSLLEEFNTINFAKIDKYKGKVIKLIGDSVFAEFDSAYHAIQASIEMQKEISMINKKKAIGKDNLSFRPIDNKQCLSMKNEQDMYWYEHTTRNKKISKAS